MRLSKLILITIFLSLLILACSSNNSSKGKKGDFLFRKCASCKKINF